MSLTLGLAFSAQAARLPAEYQEVEYIETTESGQYIDTGYVPSLATDVELKGRAPISTTGENNKIFYWSRLSSGGGLSYPSFALIIKKSTTIRCYHHSKGDSDTFTTKALADEIDFVSSGRSFTINGQNFNYTASATGYSIPTVHLFALKNGTDAVSTFSVAGMRLYALKFRENGLLKRNFVPCYRKSDNKVGLYDVSGNSSEPFYTNASTTTGEFAKGSDCETSVVVLSVMNGSQSGVTDPVSGDIVCPDGTNFTCTASAATNTTARVRSRVLGYVLADYNPDSGVSSNPVTNLNATSYTHTQVGTASHSLTWLWTNEVEVAVNAYRNGTVFFEDDDIASVGDFDGEVYHVWVPYGAPVTMTAVPSAGHSFLNWRSDTISMTNALLAAQSFATESGRDLRPTFRKNLALGTLACSGGAMEIVGDERIHTFGTNGTFTVEGEGEADVLIIAGGGGGGGYCGGGGGGAGGLIYSNAMHLTAGTYPIVIGRGGVGGRRAQQFVDNGNGTVTTNWYTISSTSGENTTAFGLTAIGGGRGGMTLGTRTNNVLPEDGGSGGGSPFNTTQGKGTAGQGNAGKESNNFYRPGGGGGAGAPANGSIGGVGLAFDISGRPRYYAGGGCANNGNLESMVQGGGGRHNYVIYTGEDGLDGTGGGGGGGGSYETYNSFDRFGGAGGSGVVIIRYRAHHDRNYAAKARATGGLEKTINLDGTKWVVHTFSNSATMTFPKRTRVQLLAVGGGGAGGMAMAASNGGVYGGGAGGGVLIVSNLVVEAGTYPITVGEGAPVALKGYVFRGGETCAFGLVAPGGAVAAGWNLFRNFSNFGGGPPGEHQGSGYRAAGAARFGWGCDGGAARLSGGGGQGGGGGGAGLPGKISTGGDGVMCDFSGEEQWYGGGGGGGIAWYKHAPGGKGGGGRGATAWNGSAARVEDADPGTPGTGGGGGGFGNSGQPGAGGSGIVIIRYQYQPPGVVVFFD